MIQEWQHMEISGDIPIAQWELDKWGKLGWEMCGCMYCYGYYRYYFKKLKQE